MIINEVIFNYSLSDIILELQSQLKMNHIHLLEKTTETTNDIMVQCPYHSNGQERRPSAGIRKDDGMLHCFACGEVRSLPEVISHCFGYEEDMGKYGWTWLLKNFATISVEQRKDIALNCNRKEESSKDPNYITEEELDSYRYIHPYMYKRKLTDEVIELFDIGYDKNTKCITFPNRDINGNCVFVARRSVQTKFFSYPEGVEKPVYGLYEIKRVQSQMAKNLMFMRPGYADFGNEIIICESMLDALTCWVYGKPAVALNGLGTPQQFAILRNFPCRKYILATDADKYGLKARKRIKEGLKGKIVTEYFWDPKVAKDINDMDQQFFLNLDDHF